MTPREQIERTAKSAATGAHATVTLLACLLDVALDIRDLLEAKK